jgi:aldose 1-epimerase
MKFDLPHTGARRPSRLKRWSASGWMTPCILALLGLCLVFGSYEHRNGRFHVLRERVAPTTDEPVRSSGPGGQDPIVLKRQINANIDDPEFTSATLLPGRGFNLWQLTAYLPGHGIVPLLVSPPVAEASTLLAGTGADVNGSGSTKFGGAFLVPFANYLTGVPAPGIGMLQTQWQDQRLSFPASSPDSLQSVEGLLLMRGADTVKVSNGPSSSSALATFQTGSFGGGWPGNTDTTILVELSGHTLILTVTAQNVGTSPEPFGIGWHPYFAILFGDRSDTTLVIPSNTHITQAATHGSLPSGDIDFSDDAVNGFDRAEGTPLGSLSLDDSYVDLRSAVLADGPITELRDPAAGYGLRITTLTPNIKTLHVVAPADKQWISIQPNMNVPDPFGHEWDKLDSTGMVTLQPGDSVIWKVRVEIFPLVITPPN